MSDADPILTFPMARELIRLQLGPRWSGPGTFHVDATGYEDGRFYRLIIGSREWLVDQKTDFVDWDTPVVLVEKSTGHVSTLPWNEGVDGPYDTDHMTPVTDPSA